MPEVLDMIYDGLKSLQEGQDEIKGSISAVKGIADEANLRSKTNRWMITTAIGGLITMAVAVIQFIVPRLIGG